MYVRRKFISAVVMLTALATSSQVRADGNVQCDSQRADRKPMIYLQRELKAKGWTVRRIQPFNGCYEVYGYDDKDKAVEAYFHPVTFVRVHETIAGFRDPASFDPATPPAPPKN